MERTYCTVTNSNMKGIIMKDQQNKQKSNPINNMAAPPSHLLSTPYPSQNLWGRLFWFALFVIGIVCIWKTQRTVPIMMDDEWYSTVLSSDAPLASMWDIVQAQVWHYLNWGGRTVAHTIAQFIFLYMKEPVADLLNTLLILLLAWMMNALMKIPKRYLFAYTTLTVGFVHGLNANWKMSMYWQTGACNYLYTTILILAFLWIYLHALDRLGAKADASSSGLPVSLPAAPSFRLPSAALLLPVSILGLLCGWTNENMGPTIWILTILVMLLHRREKAPIPLWMVSGSAFCLLGSVLMILAPGNGVRSAEIASNSYGVLWQIFLRMYGVCKGAWEYLFPSVLAVASVLFINLCILKNRLTQKEILLLLGAVLSWGAMVLSPHYPDRASFGTMCFLLCILSSQSCAILKSLDNKWHKVCFAGTGVFLWLRGMYFLGEFLAICWGWIR